MAKDKEGHGSDGGFAPGGEETSLRNRLANHPGYPNSAEHHGRWNMEAGKGYTGEPERNAGKNELQSEHQAVKNYHSHTPLRQGLSSTHGFTTSMSQKAVGSF